MEFANKRAEIDAMPNGGVTLSVYTENDIETCRDVLFYVAQVLGGFFIINREGKLELRKYGKDPVMKVEQRHRFSSSFSDFITRYTAVSSTNKQTQIAEYYALDPDNGLTMNLGVNPLLQFGLEETREMLCRNILADLSVIRYVPFDSDTIGNPALDPGYVIVYNWDKAVQPNDGYSDHIGFVEKVSGGKVTAIEGNRDEKVDRRVIPLGWGYIRGYAAPRYEKAVNGTGGKPGTGKKSVETVAKEVLAGKWGNGEDRKKRLQAAGYDYGAVQRKVNELMR